MARFVPFQGQDEPGKYLVHPLNENEPCDVEIVFVHGLMGKPTKTWRHPDNDCVFFRDLLPRQLGEQVPRGRARIWSYGYPADLGFQTAQIYDFAISLLHHMNDIRSGLEGRRIIWVCHSLGGIVVKRALNEASGQKQYNDILDATIGIIFLGTPHQGSSVATIGQVAAGIVGTFLPAAQILNRPLLRHLEKNSDALFETSNRFANICSKLTIYTFYETRPWKGTRCIVPRESAVLSHPNEKSQPLDANHQSICRYKDPTDHNWLPVLNCIVNMVKLTIQPTPRPIRTALHGFGNQRQPQAPYPRDSIYQQQRPVHTNGAPYPTSSTRSPSITSRSSHTSTTHSEQSYGAYYNPYAPEQPEVARRPVPPSNPPPRPPKQPLVGGSSSSDSTTSTISNSSSSSSDQFYPRSESSVSLDRRERRPYPGFNTAYAREEPSPHPISRTPQASQGQSRSQAEETNDVPENHTVAAMCDACENDIRCSQARFQCTECYDYDLCMTCYSLRRVSKTHKLEHVARHIVKTEVLPPHEFTPPRDDVNPETSADALTTYVTLETNKLNPEDKTEYRWHHLHDTDNHFRYLTGTVQPGHYAAHLTIVPHLSDSLGQEGRNELKKSGLGYIRIGLGTIKDKKQFFGTRYREDSFTSDPVVKDNLIEKLLDVYWWDVMRLPGDGQPFNVHADGVIPVEKAQDLGLVVQWSKVRAFQNDNDAVVSLNVGSLVLYDIRDFLQPLRVPPSAPTVDKPVEDDDEDDDDETITAEQLLAALAEIQQQVEDANQRAQLEWAIKRRLQQQEDQRQKALLTLAFANAIQEQARKEKERREEEEARELLRRMGFDF